MKQLLLLAVSLMFFSTAATAHYLWVDTQSTGTSGVEQTVKVHAGEYTYGLIEPVGEEAFERVRTFNCG